MKFIGFILFISLLISRNLLACEIPQRLKGEIDPGLVTSILNSAFKSSELVMKEKVCALDTKERSSGSLTSQLQAEQLEEIKYLVCVQEKYAKPLMGDVASSGGEVCREKCQRASELQRCIISLAERRRKAIEQSGFKGFQCFTRFENGAMYLDARLQNSNLLTDFKDSFIGQQEFIKRRMSACRAKVNDWEIKPCLDKVTEYENRLNSNCPQKEHLTSVSRSPRGSGGSSSRGTR
jgi:hypothetical protein